jgi:hypothetical protein
MLVRASAQLIAVVRRPCDGSAGSVWQEAAHRVHYLVTPTAQEVADDRLRCIAGGSIRNRQW